MDAMKSYRPVSFSVQAVRWDGSPEHAAQICAGHGYILKYVEPEYSWDQPQAEPEPYITIQDGERAYQGDWIVKRGAGYHQMDDVDFHLMYVAEES